MEGLGDTQADIVRLLREQGEMHVYAIRKALDSRSVYSAVTGLQLRGIVEARYEAGPLGRPARKYVRLK